MPVRCGRSADANKRDVGLVNRLCGVVCRADASEAMLFGHQRVDVLFDNGRTTLIDEVHFCRLGIYPDHAMSLSGKAGESDATDVTEAKNTDVHDGVGK